MTAPRPCEARAGAGLRMLRAAVFTAACVAMSAAGHGLASGSAVQPWSLAAGFCAVLLVVLPLAGRQRSLPGIAAVLAAGQIALHIVFGLGQRCLAMPRQAAGAPGAGAAAEQALSGAGASAAGHAAAVQSGAMASHMAGMAGMPAMPNTPAMPPVSGSHLSGVQSAALDHMPAHAADLLTHTGDGGLPGLGDGSSPTGYTVLLLHSMVMLPSLPMVLVHVLAAVAAGWLLRRGDLAVFRLVALSAQGVAEAALARALRAAFRLVRALRAGLPGATGTGPRPPRPAESTPLPPQAAVLQHSVIRRGPPTTRAFLLAA